MAKKIEISGISPDSAAHDADIEPGDYLVSINGHEIDDIFDYRFLITERSLLVKIEKNNGDMWEIDIEKDEYEDLGLEFDDPLISEAKSCMNKCVFCFIDQLPEGMRDTLYFKDDDSRLSFLSGNYITMTNMSQKELDRIVEYKMSPVNVSVHTTNPELRKLMLGNRFAGDVVEKIRKLTDGGIIVNVQIVLCRGLNDGYELDSTLEDLSVLNPGVASISVVPVGLTKWREGLYKLLPYDKESAIQVIKQVEEWQRKLFKENGSRLVYLADEFYIMAEAGLPECAEYEDFPQIENGVGLMPLFIYEFNKYLEKHGSSLNDKFNKHIKKRGASIATGICAYRYIKELAQILEKRYNNFEVNVYPIINNFFGENVTVAGLLTGSDLFSQLKHKVLGDELLISKSMLKSGEELFLDDYTVAELSRKLGVRVIITENDGGDFIKKVLGVI